MRARVRRACSALRQIVAAGGGKHRPHRDEVTVPVATLLRPREATVNDLAYCPAEQRQTLHAFLALGGRVCWTCRTHTMHGPLKSTPEQGGAE
ncbi:hypothetical protein ACFWFU_07085 [Streptomyces sp. NPDC060235]|uniref:hypothetical protein n=1 Tax=Streptomyces sp. NPDC060235 TaxID=3347080 RepID=UPI00365553DF